MGLESFINYDEKLNLFYDETNNIKVFKLLLNKFNNDCNRNFVLGGIALQNRISEQDVIELRNKLYLQKSQEEFKFRDVCSGPFVQSLSSKRLGIIFDFLQEKNVFIHYVTVNFLFYALADIVDSAEIAEFCSQTADIALLKTTLSRSCKRNIPKLLDVLNTYEYPNVRPDKLE